MKRYLAPMPTSIPSIKKGAAATTAAPLCLLAITASCAAFTVGWAATAHAETIAITGATIYQTPSKKLLNATLVMRDGVIVTVAQNGAVPKGARVIDGRNHVVTAGLIEAASTLGLVEVDLEATGNDGRFGNASTVHAAYRVVDAYNARSVAVPVARSGGVTSAVIRPTGGIIAGTAAWMALEDQRTAQPPLRDSVAMAAALGNQALASGSRGYAIAALRELLDDVVSYQRNRNQYERNQSRALLASRSDLEALLPVVAGKMLLLIRADAEVDIRAALALAKTRKIRIAIESGTEAWRVAKELAVAKVPVVVDPTANLPDDLAALDVRDDNVVLLDRAGVQVIISTLGNASNARMLRQLAGIAVSLGLPYPTALAAITSTPAQVFSEGAPTRGTLNVGQIADVVMWTADPLELATQVTTVFINGVEQSAASHQTKLLQRYRKLQP
ncbi:MAG: hypothetical protein KBG15_15705 [Kofleriaceae bacterium]|nr:hypothetical protein [Kofleriaceae bacterium]